MDNTAINTLRDAIRSNTEGVRSLRDELHIANLLNLLEHGLIDKNDILSDLIYLEYKKKYNLNSNIKKKSL